jgi:hypothetical protein
MTNIRANISCYQICLLLINLIGYSMGIKEMIHITKNMKQSE